jgi:hydrogenase maturation protease
MLQKTEQKSVLKTLILGVGNTLLSDDGFGVHVTEILRDTLGGRDDVMIRDGGTLGLTLLPDIEDAEHLIVIDAGELHDAPGTMRVFYNEDMDRHLSQAKGTVHEVAMSDLLDAARLMGNAPKNRALIVVQPSVTTWGERPTPDVEAVIPAAREQALKLVEAWSQ